MIMNMHQNSVADVRQTFQSLYERGRIVRADPDKESESDTVEILNAQFVADWPVIFGDQNLGYVAKELAWYLSESLNVNDIEAPVPAIWQQVAADDGSINSNYGWCIFSEENGSQFKQVARELMKNPQSRRAQMIYTRPSMHQDAFVRGMSDFMCTSNVQCFIRDRTLHYAVYMRSNDAVFGYKNDLAWHEYVHGRLLSVLKETGRMTHLAPAPITWNAASLHVYRRHFHLI